MKAIFTTACAAFLVLASCGGNGGEGGSGGTADTADSTGAADAGDNGGTATAGIDVCALLSDEEIAGALGRAPITSRPTEPIAGLTGCSWDTGLLIVQIRPSSTLITAPFEVDCPSANVGEDSIVCNASLDFISNNIHASVTTIENVEEAQLVAIAMILEPRLRN